MVDNTDDSAPIVGTLVAVLPWNVMFKNVLNDPYHRSIYVVVEQDETCVSGYQAHTFQLAGQDVTYMGEGELHDVAYTNHGISATFGGEFVDDDNDACHYTVTVYPSAEMYQKEYSSNTAAIWTSIVVVVILLAGAVFFGYDYAVQKRQSKTLESAAKTNAIVASLFPTEVLGELLGKKSKKKSAATNLVPTALPDSTKFRLKSYLAEEDGAMTGAGAAAHGAGATDIENDEKVKEALAGIDMHETKPIAELFPNTTVSKYTIMIFCRWD
jgi:hypothetical protein